MRWWTAIVLFSLGFVTASALFLALSKTNLTETDLKSANLIDAVLDSATLTAVKLWESQRTNWSIKNVICESAFWDRKGTEVTNYAPGEFERLYSEKTKIQLHYSDGIQPIEIATRPALVQKLASEHEGCVLRIRSIQEDAGGATVTISIDNPRGRDILELKKEL